MCVAVMLTFDPALQLRLALLIRAGGIVTSESLRRLCLSERDREIAVALSDLVAEGRVARSDLGWEWVGP